jgi:hypothetical protein
MKLVPVAFLDELAHDGAQLVELAAGLHHLLPPSR